VRTIMSGRTAVVAFGRFDQSPGLEPEMRRETAFGPRPVVHYILHDILHGAAARRPVRMDPEGDQQFAAEIATEPAKAPDVVFTRRSSRIAAGRRKSSATVGSC